MRLTITFLLTCILQVSAFAFEEDITIKKDNASLETVFREIERQSPYRFFFNETLMKMAVRVTVNIEKATLMEALEACFNSQPTLTYAIIEKTIIVKRRPNEKSQYSDVNKIFGTIAEVRGFVNSSSGPVPGATVSVRGTEKVTTTNNAGEFLLYEVDDNAVLVISSVSHHEQLVRLKGKGVINITLTEKVSELEEQVVLAYNTSTKKSNIGAITTVKGDEVRDLPYRSVDKSLQGLVPGLLVTSGNGQPGGGLSNFVLRGIATGGDAQNGSTVRNPLIVVDGIPVTQDNFQWHSNIPNAPVVNPMAQLSPSDIESITILKDAAAIALYGAKASNGVILITTKKGKAGKTTFNLHHQTDISSQLDGNVQLLNQTEYLQLLYETYKNTPRVVNGVPTPWNDEQITADIKAKFPKRADGSFYPETNWQDETYNKNALTNITSMSVSGGNERNRFYINLEYDKQDGIFKNTGYDRKSIRFNYENRPADWFKFGLNSTLSYNIQDYTAVDGSTFPFGIASFFPPLIPARNEEGDLILNYTFPSRVANPIAASQWNTNRNTAYRGLTKLYGELSFLKHFKLTSSVGADFMMLEAKERVDPRLYDYADTKKLGGRQRERFTRSANLITTNILRFDKVIDNRHSVGILLGQEAQIISKRHVDAYATSIVTPDFDYISNGFGSTLIAKETMLSWFSQANYGYKGKYFLTGSVRRDGSSRFGENRRFGTYWSAGSGWILSSEKFMQKTKSWLEYFKIRGSIGAAGNTSAIDQYTRFDQLTANNYLNNQAFHIIFPANTDIQWEQTFTWDAGVDAKFWNSRIAITADIYKRKTSNLIQFINLTNVAGFYTIPDNIGDIENSGIELSLSLDIIKLSDFTWNLNANWSTNKNILVKASVPLALLTGSGLANEVGRNFNSFYVPIWAGVDPTDGRSMFIDSTGKPNSNYNAAKREFVGKPQPDGFGAVTHSFTYKNLALSAQFYYQYGFQIFNSNALTNDGRSPYFNQDKRALNYWKKPGDITPNPKRTLNNSSPGSFSTRFLSNGDFVRFQALSLSYSFPKKITDQLGLSLFRIYARGHNLALWNTFPGRDPADVNVSGQIDFSYPNQRSYSFGVDLSF